MRAAIYARYSTDNQSHETIEVQVEKCADYAQSHDLDIVDVYADEAVSGMKTDRPDFKRLMQDAKLKCFNCVLIYDQSRFSRDIVDWFTFRRAMQAEDIQIISVTQPLVGGDLNNTAVFASEGINALVNQIHVLQTREKVVDAMNRMAKQGLYTGGRPLLGYRVEENRYAIDEFEADIVRLIFSLYTQGKSYKSILRVLNEKGYKTKRGNPFGTNSLSSLLRNERYIGVYTYNKIPPAKNGKRNSHAINPNMVRIENAVPPIVSKETWNIVQHRLSDHKMNAKGKAKVEYLLTGKGFCGKCGFAMVGMQSNYTHHFYMCSGKQRLKNCDKKNIRKDLLETLVAQTVQNALVEVQDREEIARELYNQQLKIADHISPKVKAIRARISDTSKRIDNINKAISEGFWSDSTITALKSFEKEKNELYTELACVEKTRVVIDNSLEDILGVLERLAESDYDDLKNKKALLSFIERINVFDDYIDVIVNPLKKEIPANIKMPVGTSMNGAADRT